MVRNSKEDAQTYAAHDAFLAFVRAADTDAADVLWLRFSAAQAHDEAYLMVMRGVSARSIVAARSFWWRSCRLSGGSVIEQER
jgi:hypothetical protein